MALAPLTTTCRRGTPDPRRPRRRGSPRLQARCARGNALDLLPQEVVDPTGLIARTRARLADAGGPLLEAARSEGAVRDDLGFGQVLDLVTAVAKVAGSPAYTDPILEAALAGIRPSR